ncbi:7-carboxy-7-deazaguanine synthase QueE [Puniceicoccaceae bacterium K14]|nr:7-carboxy-7-deazaguanine synthase QueE [Puniceicoccaceae bacterium K14]
MSTYPIHETFHSWQGEGMHLGRSAYFIRLFGCPVHCPWCDSAGTWHADFKPKNIQRVSALSLASKAAQSGCEFVVITGGEPTVHDLKDLTSAIRAEGLSIHLETCGAFPIKGNVDWVTLSPKWAARPLEQNLATASEFKIIVEDATSIERWVTELGPYFGERPVWLHPEWSQRSNNDVLCSITNYVKKHGAPFRAGFQMHKLFKADLLDSGSLDSAPLGGNPSLGF